MTVSFSQRISALCHRYNPCRVNNNSSPLSSVQPENNTHPIFSSSSSLPIRAVSNSNNSILMSIMQCFGCTANEVDRTPDTSIRISNSKEKIFNSDPDPDAPPQLIPLGYSIQTLKISDKEQQNPDLNPIREVLSSRTGGSFEKQTSGFSRTGLDVYHTVRLPQLEKTIKTVFKIDSKHCKKMKKKGSSHNSRFIGGKKSYSLKCTKLASIPENEIIEMDRQPIDLPPSYVEAMKNRSDSRASWHKERAKHISESVRSRPAPPPYSKKDPSNFE